MDSTRLYGTSAICDSEEGILAMARSPDGAWLATLTASSLWVWSARQHRVVLGHYPRHPSSLESDGENVRLCWRPDSHTLAVSTAGSFVYLYQVQEANGGASAQKHPSILSAEDCARLLDGQFHVSISLTQKVQAAVHEGAGTGALAASSTYFWLGVAGGVLLAIDWSAQDPTPRKLHLRPPASAEQEPYTSAGVTAVCCTTELDLVVGLDADGRAGYSFGCEACSGEVATTASALLLPTERGTTLSVSVGQRLLCVGCASGALLLFRIGTEEGRQGAESVQESAAPAPDEIRLERKLTLSPWGISPEECGAVVAVDWSDDGLGLAAVWDCRSRPGIWSPLSGACTFVPPANDSSALAPSDTSRRASAAGQRWRLMPCAVAWAENGLALWTAVGVGASSSDDSTSEDGPTRSEGGLLAETVLVQPCASRGPCQNEAARRCLYTHDRVLMLTQHNFVATGQTQRWPAGGNRDENVSVTKKAVSAVDTKFVWRELAVPWKYLADNWPVRHVSASRDGTQLAVSGARGLTLLDLRTKRWRVFGDVTQERELDCVGLAWFRHIVIVYAITEQSPAQENIWGDSNRQASSSVQVVQLHLYPRKHLDRSSRLFSPASLPAPPHCVDVDEQTGILATLCKDGSLILHQLWLHHDGGDDGQNFANNSDPHNSEAISLRAVTLLADCRLDWAVAPDLGDLTVQKMRLAPAALILPCSIPFASTLSGTEGKHESDVHSVDVSRASAARRTRAGQLAKSAAAGIASLCLMLFRGGRLELYDAISGVRLRVATNVADFWLTPVSSLPFQDVAALPLLWYCDPTGRLSVCRTGDLAKNWAAAVAAHRAHPGSESTSAVQTWRAMHCWGDKQDASEAWTVGLSEHYGVLLRVSALHWSGSGARPRGRDTLATGVLGYGCNQGCGLVINQSPVLHRLFESLLTPTSDNNKGGQETDTAAATVAATAGDAACAAICQRCSPAWPSLAASLEWLLHGALETVGTKVKNSFEGANGHATTTLDATVHGMNTLLFRVLQVLRCFPEEYEGIIGRCARTMDPAYWAPLFQDLPLGAGQPSLLFEACLSHTPPQLRNAAHYLIILQTTLPNSGQSASENWQTYPPRLVEMALATGEYSLVTEVLQFLRRAEAYANAAAEYNAESTGTTTTSQVEINLSSRRSAFGRVRTTHEAMNEPESARSPTAAESIGGKGGGWLEFLGFVNSSTSASDFPAGAESMQHTESESQQHVPELQQDSTEADHDGTDSKHASLIQTRIVPLIEAHALGLLQELRLSELVRCVDAAAGTGSGFSHSDFQLGSWLRRLDKGELARLAEIVEDFGASLRTVATMMEHDRRRQQELRFGQRPGSIVVAEDVEGEAPGDADGTASSMLDPRAVRELGHCLAAAGLVDLGLLLPTVCGDAAGAAGILRAAAPQGYNRYDAYASGLLRFALGPTPGHMGKPAAGSAATTTEAERQVTIFLDRLTENSLPITCSPRPGPTSSGNSGDEPTKCIE